MAFKKPVYKTQNINVKGFPIKPILQFPLNIENEDNDKKTHFYCFGFKTITNLS